MNSLWDRMIASYERAWPVGSR